MTNEESAKFRKQQWKFIICSMIAYAFFYITRKNLSMAQPLMLEEKVITTEQIGVILTVHGVLYGVSRFVNGFWADRLNGRIFMTIGLALSAAMNYFFGCTSLAIMFGIFWVVNAWTQGMGFPPCAKMLTHWIHPKELATKMSIWNTSHSFGSAMALGICSLLLALGFGWRWCFYLPAILAAIAAVFCFFCVKDSPTEAGVPELELSSESTKPSELSKPSPNTVTTKDRLRLVYGNPVIWVCALANFFVYIVRFGFLDWGPTFLKQYKGIPVSKGGLMTIAFELAAVVGTIFAGWFTDRVFKGRGVRTCVFCMLFTAVFSFAFWFLPNGHGAFTQFEVPNAGEAVELPAEYQGLNAAGTTGAHLFDTGLAADRNCQVELSYASKKDVKKILSTNLVWSAAADSKSNGVKLNLLAQPLGEMAEENNSAFGDFVLFSCRMVSEENGQKVVLREYVPAMRKSDQVMGLYDRKEGKFSPSEPGSPIWLVTLVLMGAGFCIYGPQALIGIVAANQATKEAAAMANGFTGIMGYAATTVSGYGVAYLCVHYGWGVTLGSFAAFALIGMVLFLLAWNAQATGYKKK